MKHNIQWAAGFFEGEGSVHIMKTRDRNYRRLCLSLSQVNIEPLLVFRNVLKAGEVRGPYGPYSGNRKPHFQYMVYGPAAIRVARKLRPYLTGKRQTLDKVVQPYVEYLSDET